MTQKFWGFFHRDILKAGGVNKKSKKLAYTVHVYVKFSTVSSALVQGESQKRAGPRMGPRENHREAGRTAKTGETDKSGGTQKRKRNKQTSACAGVSCDYLVFCLSKTNKKQKRRRRKTEGRENEPRKTRPDINRIFPTVSGAKRQKIKQKHRPKPTEKHKANATTQKQKFAPENFFKKRP